MEETLSTIKKNNVGNSYDILKFVMALLIVAIHTQAFEGPFACNVFKPFLEVAVPVFFILSSMFFFTKLRRENLRWKQLKHFLLRLGLLYFFWFIVNIVFVEHEHRYFIDAGIMDIFRLIKDVLLRSTYSGSWFFSALGLSVATYTMIYKQRWLLFLLFIISLIGFVYIHEIDYIPEQLHGLYKWWQSNVREEVTLSILEALPWVGVGYFLSSDRIQTWMSTIKEKNKPILLHLLFLVLVLVCLINYNYGYKPLQLLIRFVIVLYLITLAGTSRLTPKPIYFEMRKMSVLFFMLHFVAIKIWSLLGTYVLHLDSWQEHIGNMGFYFLILASCLVISICILYLQNKKQFNWLKYSC